jgi:mono/diheme cytochrome c family protein
MGRVALRLLAGLAGLLLFGGTILLAVASRRLSRRYDEVPAPAITRDSTPDGLARGARLFRIACASCHTAPGQARPLGARLANFPESFGTVYSTNLTSDPQGGIGALTDGQIARLLRYGVLSDGRYSRSMPRMKALGDGDVAALIGFLRSGDPLFAPSPTPAPPSRLSLFGRVVLAFAGPVDTRADAVIPVPPRGPNAAYGRYLATAVYGCVECHSEGFTPLEQKLAGPNLLAGGFQFPDPRGDPIESSNLTPDPETGLGKWKPEDFERALLTGVGPSGFTVRPPMPIFRYSDREEMAAIFEYLRAVPAVKRQTRVFQMREHPEPGAPPEELFAKLGCMTCHGAGAPFRDRLKQSAQRPLSQVADSILHPEIASPGTQMPTFAPLLDRPRAIALAQWIQKMPPKTWIASGAVP